MASFPLFRPESADSGNCRTQLARISRRMRLRYGPKSTPRCRSEHRLVLAHELGFPGLDQNRRCRHRSCHDLRWPPAPLARSPTLETWASFRSSAWAPLRAGLQDSRLDPDSAKVELHPAAASAAVELDRSEPAMTARLGKYRSILGPLTTRIIKVRWTTTEIQNASR